MLTHLHISNLKSIVDLNLTMQPLTLLSGLNNAGKSTVLQALRMYHAASQGQSPFLKGHGDIDALRSQFASPNAPVNIDVGVGGLFTTYKLGESPHQHPPCPDITYLSAERWGPRVYLPVEQSTLPFPKVGERGQYTLDYIDKLRDALIPHALHHVNAEGRTLLFQLKGWLSEISPTVQFDFQIDAKADISTATLNGFRPTNSGFGLSYTLPVIAAILGAVATPPKAGWSENWGEKRQVNREKGSLLILENPEAHLHPQGQTAMGKLIAMAAQANVQILLETHSDHLMDGIRIAVKQKQLAPDKANFHFFSLNKEGQTEVASPNIDGNGKLSFWPEGFFDQTLKNRAILARR